MTATDFRISILVDQSATEVFNAINDVRSWWTENLEGNSENLNDEFTVRFGNVHVSTQKLVELVPGKKVVWLITDSKLNFLEDKKEWNGSKISFELSIKENKTELKFTHHGLIPQIECFNNCSNAWRQYIKGSLLNLISTGKGNPTLKKV